MIQPLFAVDVREAGQVWVHRLVDWLPPAIRDLYILGLMVWQWIGLVALIAVSLILGTVLKWLLMFVLRHLADRAELDWEAILRDSPGPVRWALAVVLMFVLLPVLELPEGVHSALEVTMRTALIIIGAWVLIRLAAVASAILEAYLVRQTSNPGLQRSIRTQILVPLRVFRFLIVLLALALVLIQFELVRTVGLSMLAAAGVAGVVIGLAAQRTVANLLAGIQLAAFQPIRIGDAVVVEGDYGWVEEISLTYVVIKIWDERRLILPVSYFLERPFQNWTRHSAEMLGTVLLRLDYTVPVEAVRQALRGILQETALWDRRVDRVQVTDFTEKTVELRILLSAADSAQLWELRCLVREKMLEWVQGPGKDYLPLRRTETRTLMEQKMG